MRVLVTGASGFAGGHIARDLAAAGFEVTALSRSRDIVPPRESSAHARFRMARADLAHLRNPLGPHELIVHAAATSAWTGIEPLEIARDNETATRNLIDSALAHGSARMIFLSSVSTFGHIDAPVVNEATPVQNPEMYGISKLNCEAMLKAAQERMPSVSLRLPAIVGRGAKRNFLAEAARKLISGEGVTYFNPDAAFNNAVHVSDLAAFVVRLASLSWSGADMVVLSSGGTVSVREAVYSLAARLAPEARLTVGAAKKQAFLLDHRKATVKYGFRPMEIGDVLRRYANDCLLDLPS